MDGRASRTDARGLVDSIAIGRPLRITEGIAKSGVGNGGRSETDKGGHLIGQNVGPSAASIVGAIDAFGRSFDELNCAPTSTICGFEGFTAT